MTYRYKARDLPEGYTPLITRSNSPLQFVELGRLLLRHSGAFYEARSGTSELVIDLLEGSFEACVAGESFPETRYVAGPRRSPFSDLPSMLYIPPNASFSITALTGELDAVIYSAPSASRSGPVLVTPDHVRSREAGYGSFRRTVRIAVGEDIPAEKLLVGETLNPPGNWSSYPPHKHDRLDMPREFPAEEIYFFLVDPPEGFGTIRMYTDRDAPDAFDEVYTVENGDAFAIPRGYHPISAAPGYQLCYLFGLSSPHGRRFGAWQTDPRHAWLVEEPRAET